MRAVANAKQRMQQPRSSTASPDPDPLNDSCTIPPSDDEGEAEAEAEAAPFVPPSPTRLRRLRRASSPSVDPTPPSGAAAAAVAAADSPARAAAAAASPSKSAASASRAQQTTGLTRADMQKRVAQMKAGAAATSAAATAAPAIHSRPRSPHSSISRGRRSSGHDSVVIPDSDEELLDPFAGASESPSPPFSSPDASPAAPAPAPAASSPAPSAAAASAEWRPVRRKLADRSDIASHAAALKARANSSSSSASAKSRSRSSSPPVAAATSSVAPRAQSKKAALAGRRPSSSSKTRGAASKKVWVKMDDDDEQQMAEASPAVKSESDDAAPSSLDAASVVTKRAASSAAASAASTESSPPSSWNCSRCTMANDLAAKVCSMCEAKRPASAAAAAAAAAKSTAAPHSKKGRRAEQDSDDSEAEPSSSEEEDAKAKAKRKRKPAAAAAAAIAASRPAKGGKKRAAPVPNERSLRDCFPSLPSSSQLSSPPAPRYIADEASPQRERSKLTLSVLDRSRTSSDTRASSPTKAPLVAPVSASKGKRVYHDLTISQSQSLTQSQQSQSQGDEESAEVSIVERSKVEQAAVDRSKRRKLAAASSAAALGKLSLTLSSITSTPPSARPARSASSLADSNLPTSAPSVLWIDKYAPHSEEDLCMHKAKLAEIKAWMLAFGRPPPPPRSPHSLFTAAREGRDARYGHGQTLLILAGPAGGAKSATIRVLAAALGYEIVTWDSEADTSGDGGGGGGEWESGFGSGRYERKLSRFQSFFKTSSRFALNLRPATQDESVRAAGTVGAAASTKPKSLVVIDELPYIDKPEYRAEFLSILTSAVQSAVHPVVLMLTSEHESSSCDHLLEKTFGAPFIAHPKVGVIKVNPVNNTEMIRALERVVRSDTNTHCASPNKGEQLNLSKDTMTSVLSSCSGDIRHAISALQFLNVEHTAQFDPKSAGKGANGGKVKKPRRTKKQIAEEAAAAAAAGGDAAATAAAAPAPSVRDESFSVFHSVGKILYAKADEQREVSDIIRASDVEPLEFLQWIHTNYLEHLFAPVLPRPAAPKPPQMTQAGAAAKPSTLTSTAAAAPASRSPFADDFGPDLDMDSFDQLIQSSVAAAAAAPVQLNSLAQVQQQQAVMDAEALQALVDCTHAFSDADVLAAGARGRFGDSGAADEAVEERAAAEIACRQFMQSKRAFSWANNAQLAPKKTGLTGARGPLSSKLFFHVRDKRRLFSDLFQSSFVSHVDGGRSDPAREFDLGVLMSYIQGERALNPRTAAIVNRMRGFIGRDMMQMQESLWMDILPHLGTIAAAPQQQSVSSMQGRPPMQQQPPPFQQHQYRPPHQPQMQMQQGQQRYPVVPPPPQQQQPQRYGMPQQQQQLMRPPLQPPVPLHSASNLGMRGPSPPVYASAAAGRPGMPPPAAATAAASSPSSNLWSNSASARSYLAAPPAAAAAPVLLLSPQLTPLQLQFLRGLNCFHPQSTVESLFKETAASVESLQTQVKRVGLAAATGLERMGGAAAGQQQQPFHASHGQAQATTTWMPSSALLGEVEEIEDPDAD